MTVVMMTANQMMSGEMAEIMWASRAGLEHQGSAPFSISVASDWFGSFL